MRWLCPVDFMAECPSFRAVLSGAAEEGGPEHRRGEESEDVAGVHQTPFLDALKLSLPLLRA